MYKYGIILSGTTFDRHGTITVTSECNGFQITKDTEHEAGKITLTREEIESLYREINSNFPKRMTMKEGTE